MTLFELRELIEKNLPWWAPLGLIFVAFTLFSLVVLLGGNND